MAPTRAAIPFSPRASAPISSRPPTSARASRSPAASRPAASARSLTRRTMIHSLPSQAARIATAATRPRPRRFRASARSGAANAASRGSDTLRNARRAPAGPGTGANPSSRTTPSAPATSAVPSPFSATAADTTPASGRRWPDPAPGIRMPREDRPAVVRQGDRPVRRQVDRGEAPHPPEIERREHDVLGPAARIRHRERGDELRLSRWRGRARGLPWRTPGCGRRDRTTAGPSRRAAGPGVRRCT